MHSIERYGIVALLFLVVTVVAVLMWDGNREKKGAPGKTALGAASRVDPDAPRADADANRRLSLLADSKPGPLQRHPRAGRARADAAQEAASTAPPEAGAALTNPLPDEGSAEAEAQGPRERPAPDQVIGATEAAPMLTAPPSAPSSAPTTHAYTVRAGDTLSEIAQRELGSSRRWQDLVAVNPGLDPAKLRVGKTIQIPGAKGATEVARAAEEPAASAKAPKSQPSSKPAAGGKTWKVGNGENLGRIAERALGDGKRWGEIARLNPKVNPDRLALGQVLVLPASASTGNAPKGSGKTPSSGVKTAASSKPKDAPVLLASATPGSSRRGGKVR